MLVRVMGRHAGWIALNAGLASGAHMTLGSPNSPSTSRRCAGWSNNASSGHVALHLRGGRGREARRGLVDLRHGGSTSSAARSSPGSPSNWPYEVEKRIRKEVRVTVWATFSVAAPRPPDRVLATRFGVNAADAAHAGEFGMMVSLARRGHRRVPLADAGANTPGNWCRRARRRRRLLRVKRQGLTGTGSIESSGVSRPCMINSAMNVSVAAHSRYTLTQPTP